MISFSVIGLNLCIQVLTVFVVLLQRRKSCKSVRNGKVSANERRNMW